MSVHNAHTYTPFYGHFPVKLSSPLNCHDAKLYTAFLMPTNSIMVHINLNKMQGIKIGKKTNNKHDT